MTIAGLINLVVVLLVIGVVIMLVKWVVREVAIPDPIGRVIVIAATVIGVLIAIIYLLSFAGLIAGGPIVVQ